MKLHPTSFYLNLICLLSMVMGACSVEKYIPEGEHMLTGIAVTCDDEEIQKTYALSDYVTQTTNTKWFGARVPLKIYMLSGTDTTKRSCRFWRKLGEAPVLYNQEKSERTMEDIRKVLNNAGYMKAEVEEFLMEKGKKVNILYNIHPNKRYTIRNVHRIVDDQGLRQFITVEDTAASLLKPGAPFEVTALNDERNRITSYLRNNGYYKFTKEDIRFSADTARQSSEVDVLVHVKLQQDNGRTEATPHKQYTIGNVNFLTDVTHPDAPIDSIRYKGYNFFTQDKLHFRKQVLIGNSLIHSGTLYKENSFRRTYTNYTRLSAISFSNISMKERPGTDTLDCNIIVNHAKPHSFGFDVEATNSAGDLGAALSTSYLHI
ncbi:MAG: hypothetical protein K2O61_04450, partial [Bacteroidaceae bacterium]|nr:hypothetical protein [Bacteroidaceae bacterium]